MLAAIEILSGGHGRIKPCRANKTSPLGMTWKNDFTDRKQVAEEKAVTLVRMAEGQSVTFKLTKRPATMRRIEDLPSWGRTPIR